MFATKLLSAEHNVILQVLKSLDQVRVAMEKGKRPSPQLLETAITFFENFADRFHHFKEEYLMFGLLAQKAGGGLDLQMGALRYGHELCRGYIREIAQALDDYAGGDEIATLTILGNMAAYNTVLRHHIHAEDHLFFPMVEKALSDGEKEMLMVQFDKAAGPQDAASVRKYQYLAQEIATLVDVAE